MVYELSVCLVFVGYWIEWMLGVGGMGIVYLVCNFDLLCSEVLKVFVVELLCDFDFWVWFVCEVDVVVGLDYFNIVVVY